MESNLPTPWGEPGRPRPQGPPARAASRQPPARVLRQGGLRGLPRGPPARPSRAALPPGAPQVQRLGPGPSIAALVVVPSAALGVAIQGLHRCSDWARARQLLHLWWSHLRRSGPPTIQGLHRCSNWARGRQSLHLWWSHLRRSGPPSRASTGAATGPGAAGCCTCGALADAIAAQRILKNRKESQRIAKNP